ncbi:MAG: cell division protein FtsQ/DivIB [Gammaproteobacteria bacterium]
MSGKTPLILFAVVLAFLWHLAEGAVLRGWRVTGGAEIARAEVGRMMRDLEGRNLPAMSLPNLRAQILNLPGVADAHLRRRLPDVLEVTLVARRPLASWAGGGLVDMRGARYEGTADSWLPVFSGPAERAASMADFYGETRALLESADAAIAQLRVDEDGEWRLFLRDGVMLRLGRENRRERLRRYVRYAGELRRRFAQIRAVDLRYEKGFSVSTDGEEQT